VDVALVVTLAGSDGVDLALLGLLLGGVGDDDPALGRLLLLDPLNQDAIVKRSDLLEQKPPCDSGGCCG
jgi:hypothetical protein